MSNKKIYNSITKKVSITKGWSEDTKYFVTTKNGNKYLLRISSISKYETKKLLYSIMEQIAALDIPMCVPVEFGICDDGVYSIQSWIDGEDLVTVLPMLSDTEQYVLGFKSGEILRKIHSIPAPITNANGIVKDVQKYKECGLHFKGENFVLAYIERNSHLLKNRPQNFQHGDYSIRNMMLENGKLNIIDFERYCVGDPLEDFFYVFLDAAVNPYFTTGQFRGYFNGEPPMDFFRLYALYIVCGLLSAINEAVSLGQSEITKMMKQAQDVLEWFDNMINPIPIWYLSNYTE